MNLMYDLFNLTINTQFWSKTGILEKKNHVDCNQMDSQNNARLYFKIFELKK